MEGEENERIREIARKEAAKGRRVSEGVKNKKRRIVMEVE